MDQRQKLIKAMAKDLEVNKLRQIIKDYKGIVKEYETRIDSIIEELEEEYGVIVATKSDPLCQRVNRKGKP